MMLKNLRSRDLLLLEKSCLLHIELLKTIQKQSDKSEVRAAVLSVAFEGFRLDYLNDSLQGEIRHLESLAVFIRQELNLRQ